ncbi:MAG: autotransporter-associated beta strand repeat-containing protein, partial [Verrucomicrobiales bacterium]|nr:autotransporter-associated beta strand repeat-containing protein [Verrucomicrobiales bacterium]
MTVRKYLVMVLTFLNAGWGVIVAPAAANEYTWSGADGDSWSDETKWTGSPPAGGPGASEAENATVMINGTGTVSIFNTGDAGSALKYVNKLMLGTGSRNLQPGTGGGGFYFFGDDALLRSYYAKSVIDVPITLATDLTISSTQEIWGSEGFVVRGGITGEGERRTLTVTALPNSMVRLSNLHENLTLVVDGGNRIALEGSNAGFDGNVLVKRGTFWLNGDTSLNNSEALVSNTVTVQSGGVIAANSSLAYTPVHLDGGAIGAIQGSFREYSAPITSSDGILRVGGAGGVLLNTTFDGDIHVSGILDIKAGGVGVPTGKIKLTGGSFVVGRSNGLYQNTQASVNDLFASGLLDVSSTGGLVFQSTGNTVVDVNLDFTGYAGLTLGGRVTYRGTYTPDDDTYRLGGSSADGSGQSYLLLDREDTFVDAGAATRRLIISGETNITAANHFSGGTEIRNNKVTLTVNGALGSGTIISGGTLILNNTAGLAFDNDLATQTAVSALHNVAGDTVWNGNITTGTSYTIFAYSAANSLTINGDVSLNNGTLTVSGTTTLQPDNGAVTINGSISSNGNYGITKSGSHTLTLNVANTYSGNTALNAGKLVVGHRLALQNSALALGTTPANYSVQIAAGITDLVLGGLTGTTSTGLVLQNAGGDAVDLTIRHRAANATFGGVISGDGKVTLAGTGTLALVNAQTYTGDTTVSGWATLFLNYNGGGATSGQILADTARVTLADAGTLRVSTKNNTHKTQTFSGVTLARGASSIASVGVGSGSMALNLGAVSRETGAAVNLATSVTAAIYTSNANDANGMLGGYASFAGSNWAKVGADGKITAFESADYGTNNAFVADTHVNVSSGNVNAEGVERIKSLRFANTANVTTTGNLLIESGGILKLNTGSSGTLTAATLTSGNGADLIVHQYAAAQKLTIAAEIADHDVTAIGLTKAGAGTLELTMANTYSGDTYVNAGTLLVDDMATLGAGDVLVAAGATLTLSNAAALAGDATLWFDAQSTAINLNFNDSLAVSAVSLFDGLSLSAGDWNTAQLNEYFALDGLFSGDGFITIIPEPSTWLLLGVGILTLTVLRCQKRRGA